MELSEKLRVDDVGFWKFKNVTFTQFKRLVDGVKKGEGIVCLGAGEDVSEWVEGITGMLNEEKVAIGKPDELFRGLYKLKTSKGREDLALVFNTSAKINMGKMAMWRLRFGDCSWISDYLVNYKKQFNEGVSMELNEIRKIAGLPVVEAKKTKEKAEFETSIDFENAMHSVGEHLSKSAAIVDSAAWVQWMKDTDSNFNSASAVEYSRRAREKLQLAIEAFDKFYDHMVEISEK